MIRRSERKWEPLVFLVLGVIATKCSAQGLA